MNEAYGSLGARPGDGATGLVAQPQQHRLTFTGSSNEYFRIWIVNVMLTVVTLGIYAAWAKVRTRKYFYANTVLAGHPFEYHGDPVAILKGNVVFGVVFGLYVATQNLWPMVSLALLALWFVVFPFLLHQSLKFTALNSSYRNIRFRFHGTLKEAYLTYFWFPLLVPFTLGLFFPYVMFRQRQYVFGGAAYGTSRARFDGKDAVFYGVFFKAVGLGLLASVVVGAVVGFFGAAAIFSSNPRPSLTQIYVLVGAMYAIVGFVGTIIQSFMMGNLANATWNMTCVPSVLRFQSKMDVAALIRLRLVNLLAIVFTLGLAAPWAKVRSLEFMLKYLTLETESAEVDLGHFAADQSQGSANALGEAATDFFNIDIGI